MSNPPKYTTTDYGLEIVILDNGKPYVTQRSYARFVGLNESTIRTRVNKIQPTNVRADFEKIGEKPNENNEVTCAEAGQEILLDYEITTDTRGVQKATLIPASIFARWLSKDKPDLLVELANIGAEAWLYAAAGFEIEVKEKLPQEPTFMERQQVQTLLPAWQKEAQLRIEQVNRQHEIVMKELDNKAKEIAQVNAALDAKQVVIDQAQKVGVAVEVAASKNTIPTVPISTIMGKDMRADQANRILSKMGFIKQNPNKKGSIWEVTDKAANYGKNVKANKTGQSTNPGWFEGTDLRQVLLSKYIKP